jgi:hypothetical protein
MIQNEHTARETLEALEKAHKLLMGSLGMVKNRCTEEEYKAFRSGMAQVMGQLFFLVMEPIYREHPSLAPPETPQEFLDQWKRGSN